MNQSRLRTITRLYVIPAVMLAITVGAPLLFLDRMPDPIARHWSLSGVPNGASSPLLLTVLTGGFVLVTWITMLFIERRGTASAASTAVVYFIGSLFASLQVVTVWANLDAASWEEAASVGGLIVLVVVVIAVGVGALGWALSGGGPVLPYRSAELPIATIPLSSSEDAVWLGKAESTGLTLLAVGMLVIGVVTGGAVGALLLIVAVVGVVFAAVRVRVNARGVDIGLAWWGWPHKLIPLESIERAEILDVEPMSFGGWGFRVVTGRGLTGTRAIVVRRGPGIRLVRNDAADLVVTVDDAENGAGLVNVLLERSGRSAFTEDP